MTEMPNGELVGDSPYRAAFAALEQYDAVAQRHEQSSETLEAQLTVHGFDRDQQMMAQIHALREAAGMIRLASGQARQILIANHAQGDEYHRGGTAADSSAFRNG